MNYQEVKEKLQQIHHDNGLNDAELVMDVPFRDQGYDSLDQVEFLMRVEKEFFVTISDAKAVDLKTPEDFASYIIFLTHFNAAEAQIPPTI